MRKILFLLGIVSMVPVFALNPASAESSGACQQYREQMHQNHLAIDQAYEKQDACTMGKLMIQNRQIFESHPGCFPPRNRKMLLANPQSQGSANK